MSQALDPEMENVWEISQRMERNHCSITASSFEKNNPDNKDRRRMIEDQRYAQTGFNSESSDTEWVKC